MDWGLESRCIVWRDGILFTLSVGLRMGRLVITEAANENFELKASEFSILGSFALVLNCSDLSSWVKVSGTTVLVTITSSLRLLFFQKPPYRLATSH